MNMAKWPKSNHTNCYFPSHFLESSNVTDVTNIVSAEWPAGRGGPIIVGGLRVLLRSGACILLARARLGTLDVETAPK